MFTHPSKKFAALAAAVMLFVSSSAMAVTYRLGDETSEVSTIQTALKQLKFYSGSITGHYGERTEEAVKKFQSKYNLEADGIVGNDTLKLLYQKAGISSSSSSSSSSSTSSSSSSSSSVLRYGSDGSDVKTLQTNLSKLGYYKGSITGHYGSKTEAAVAAFQKANNLSADGIAGAKTIAAIASKASTTTTTTTTSTSSLTLDTSTSLSEGSKSDTVLKMQKMLKALGYYSSSLTGSFGSKTKAAVVAFQKAKGLTADGIAGTKTLAAINADYKNGNTATDVANGTVKVNTSNVIYNNFYNWRTRYANGEYCTVYDPATGYSWKLRIMTKDAHMDAEPATADDTAKMNKAFGGKQTWTPKVVFVTFSDGRVYIGATHNVPHGTSHLGTNNFSGHLCVHFPLTMEKAQSIGSYATQHQEAIDAYWKKLQASKT